LLEISILDDVRAGRLSAARVVEPAMIGHVCLVHAPRKSGDRAAREIALLVREVAVDVARNGGAGLSVG
jgi:hypothetical protein